VIAGFIAILLMIVIVCIIRNCKLDKQLTEVNPNAVAVEFGTSVEDTQRGKLHFNTELSDTKAFNFVQQKGSSVKKSPKTKEYSVFKTGNFDADLRPDMHL
jgi:hypothetical protein